MRVYELMNKLAEMPSGLEVKICMVKDISEIPVLDGKSRSIDFVLKEVCNTGNKVTLDGWTE